jgi:hypothetical protein
MQQKTLFLISDLMFRSRVKETLGQPDLLFAKSFDKAKSLIDTNQIDSIIIDLALSDSENIIKLLRQSYPELEILAFGSHVLEDKLQSAKENGATKVMANSGFVKWLESHRNSSSAVASQKGASWLSIIIFGLIVWAGSWYLFHLIPIYYRYYELENAFRGMSKVANELNDKEIRKRLLFQMKDIGVPGDITQVHTERLPNSLRIQYSYYEDITFTFGDHSWLIQDFNFELDINEEPLL